MIQTGSIPMKNLKKDAGYVSREWSKGSEKDNVSE
jgi:hypothetical protein